MGAGWFFSPHAAARSKSGCRSLTARNRNNSPRREKTGIRTGPISVARRDGCHAMRLGACRLNAVTHLAAVAQIVTRFLRLAQQGAEARRASDRFLRGLERCEIRKTTEKKASKKVCVL